ncbi:MAG: DUF960 domain-containing protein [Oscillospiraceae bacterium]
MFDSNSRYITKGVEEQVPLELMILMWIMIDRKKQSTTLDYLQVFTFSEENGTQTIVHEQEQPKPFKDIYKENFPHTFSGKVYVIDDGDHETMLLAEEY